MGGDTGRVAQALEPGAASQPAEAEDRAVPGHWEGDLITSTRNQSAIGTLVERTTRFTILLHLPHGHDAEHVQRAIIDKMASLPELPRNSLTWDQGAELALHKRITTAPDMQVYFCDPHSPWRRGTNENTNGLLRQYFPKGRSSNCSTPRDNLNNRQRGHGRPLKPQVLQPPLESTSCNA